MKISMKYWKIGEYFGSIALAVGIGMFATTAREGVTVGNGGPGCIYSGELRVTCYSQTQGACANGMMYNAVVPVPVNNNNNYKAAGTRIQYSCSGTGCPYNTTNQPITTIAIELCGE